MAQLLLGRWEQRPDGTLTWYWANKFETTLHSINSAVLKMSKLTVAGIVYRGIQGSALPKSFSAFHSPSARFGSPLTWPRGGATLLSWAPSRTRSELSCSLSSCDS